MTTKRTRTAKQTQNRRTSPKVSEKSTRLRSAPQTQEHVDDDSSREEEPPLRTTTAPATTTERAGDSNEGNGSKATVMVNGGNSVSSPLTLATGLVSAAEAKKICDLKKDGVMTNLTNFIRSFAWPEMKFSPNSKARERLILACLRSTKDKCPEGLRQEQFVAYFYEKVSKIFSKMRHNAQTCARQRYLRQMKLEPNHPQAVPSDFPKGVLIEAEIDENGKTKYRLPAGYRKESTKEFRYFVEQIITSMDGKHSQFESLKRHRTIDEIFTESHEAYALLMLYNEFECWDATHKQLKNDNGTPKRMAKKFTGSDTGDKKGMSLEGLMLYQQLVHEIIELRKTDESRYLVQKLSKDYVENEVSSDANKTQKYANPEPTWDVESSMKKDTEFYKEIYGPTSTITTV